MANANGEHFLIRRQRVGGTHNVVADCLEEGGRGVVVGSAGTVVAPRAPLADPGKGGLAAHEAGGGAGAADPAASAAGARRTFAQRARHTTTQL